MHELIDEADFKELQALLADPARLVRSSSELALHAHDESPHPQHLPDAVAYPLDTPEISRLVCWAQAKKVPLTPWGAGTSLEGNPIPAHGGLVLDMRRMNKIINIRAEDLLVIVQPGLLHTELNQRLAKHGLFFPPDPGAPAALGGMMANNAAGIQATRYGASKRYLLALELVLPGGEVIRLGSQARFSSSGYNLKGLIAGSEGTLGVISELTLRLMGVPPEMAAAIVSFPDLQMAAATVVGIVQAGIAPAALELLDAGSIKAINAFKGLALEEKPTLFMEFHGNLAAVRAELAFAEERSRAQGALDFRSGLGRAERDRLWEARHQLYYAAAALNPGKRAIVTDVAVPISRLPQMIEFAGERLAQLGIQGPIVGHAGDGNFHVGLFYDPAAADELARAGEANAAIVKRALELGGTATGEHGVGLGKTQFMESEHGASLQLMRRLKGLFDPEGLMNPGKIFPA